MNVGPRSHEDGGDDLGSRCLTQARTGLTSASIPVPSCVDISLGIASV